MTPLVNRALALCILGLGLAACEPDAGPQEPAPRFKEIFHLNAFEKEFGYAQAVKIGKTLYVSGCVSVDRQGRLVAPNDMPGQLVAAYHNLEMTLRAHGAGFENVVKETLYTTNMEELLVAAPARFKYYSKDGLPASTWVEVRRLVDPGFLIAIEAVAELP